MKVQLTTMVASCLLAVASLGYGEVKKLTSTVYRLAPTKNTAGIVIALYQDPSASVDMSFSDECKAIDDFIKNNGYTKADTGTSNVFTPSGGAGYLKDTHTLVNTQLN